MVKLNSLFIYFLKQKGIEFYFRLDEKSQSGYELQLNEYETDPYFLQLSQNVTSDCLFTFVFFPRSYLNLLTCFEPKIVLNIKTKQVR